MRMVKILSICVLFVFLSSPAWAHRLIKDDGSHTGPGKAIPLGDIDVSQVAYHQATPESAQLWLTFDGQAGQTLDYQLGVPRIDRFKDYRPAAVLLGPGLPGVTLPFEVPEGLGGRIFDTTGTEPSDEFYEEFTGTTSWRFPQQSIVLPETGKYYLVGYVPSAASGKFWIAAGTAEKFTFSDIVSLPAIVLEVRAFHEVGPIGGLAMWAMIILAGLLTLLAFFLLV